MPLTGQAKTEYQREYMRRRRAALLEEAAAGILPLVPDFTAQTHRSYRKKLLEVVALVQASDIEGLKAYKMEPKSSSRKAICKYRDLAITALEARRQGCA